MTDEDYKVRSTKKLKKGWKRLGPQWYGVKSKSEIVERALRQRVRRCEVKGCLQLGADWKGRSLCPSHKGQAEQGRLPKSMSDYGPKVEGNCNWPKRERHQGRCRNPAGRCPYHKGEPPL